MVEALVWISGISGGIGRALAASVPWEGTRVIGIGRRSVEGAEHVEADLSSPSSWSRVGASFTRELAAFDGARVVFVHAAGSIDPIGFAGEVDADAYGANVVLNSAAPQILGNLFLAAVRQVRAERHLVMLSSGAARSVYEGWSAYGAAKAGTDQWVRDVGAEQERRGGVHVVSVAPGTVDTGMQASLRACAPDAFPARQKFVDLHAAGRLTSAAEAGAGIWGLLDLGLANGSVVDLRDLPPPTPTPE